MRKIPASSSCCLFFQGRMLWLDTLVKIMVYLITNIMGDPKDGPEPSQYFIGKDNDNRLAARLKKKYGLQRDGRAYHIDGIND